MKTLALSNNDIVTLNLALKTRIADLMLFRDSPLIRNRDREWDTNLITERAVNAELLTRIESLHGLSPKAAPGY